MNDLKFEPVTPMTTKLVEYDVFVQDNVSLIDVGAADGIDNYWQNFCQ